MYPYFKWAYMDDSPLAWSGPITGATDLQQQREILNIYTMHRKGQRPLLFPLPVILMYIYILFIDFYIGYIV